MTGVASKNEYVRGVLVIEIAQQAGYHRNARARNSGSSANDCAKPTNALCAVAQLLERPAAGLALAAAQPLAHEHQQAVEQQKKCGRSRRTEQASHGVFECHAQNLRPESFRSPSAIRFVRLGRRSAAHARRWLPAIERSPTIPRDRRRSAPTPCRGAAPPQTPGTTAPSGRRYANAAAPAPKWYAPSSKRETARSRPATARAATPD